MTQNAGYFMTIEFNGNLPHEDVPNVNVIIISEDNSYGIIDISWVDGKEYVLETDPKYGFEYDLEFQIHQHERLRLTSNCSQSVPYYKCMSAV